MVEEHEEQESGVPPSTTPHNFEISSFSIPPRSTVLDVSLESDNEEEDQEARGDLEQKEKEDEHKAEGVRGEDFIPYCVSCDGTVCDCEDRQQVIFFPSDEEYYEDLDEASRKHSGDLDEDERFRSSDDHLVSILSFILFLICDPRPVNSFQT